MFVYERFNYRAFTGKFLVCLIAGRLWEVVAHRISKVWKLMVNVSEKAVPAIPCEQWFLQAGRYGSVRPGETTARRVFQRQPKVDRWMVPFLSFFLSFIFF